MKIVRLRALEKRRGPPKLTGLQQRIFNEAARLIRLGHSRQQAIDAALDQEF
jgi:hypothetical protein